MLWRISDLWKVGTVIVGMPILLALMVWVPGLAADAHETMSGFTVPKTTTVQITPTTDATVTTLNKEKLQHENDWWWNNGATIITSVISTFTLAAAGIFTVMRYFNDRRDAREKQDAEAQRVAEDRKAERERRDEEQHRWLQAQEAELEKRAGERFQAAIEGLSSEREEAKVAAAVLLRTFLRPGYKQFYVQTFDLAVANLRLPYTVAQPEDPAMLLSPTTLHQALIMVFKEAFPLARDNMKSSSKNKSSLQSLDATGIQLDYAYLRAADLKQMWMPQASLRNVNLIRADLRRTQLKGVNLSGADLRRTQLNDADLRRTQLNDANLRRANLSGANLSGTDLRRTQLKGVNLSGADLSVADLSVADLSKVNLSRAKLNDARLNEANLRRADLSKADLSRAYLSGADLSGADLNEADLNEADLSDTDLTGVKHLEDVRSLKGTNLHRVKGLTQGQLEACKARGAILNEDLSTSSSLSIVAPLQSLQNTPAQASISTTCSGEPPTP